MLDSKTFILFIDQLPSLEYKLQDNKNVFSAVSPAPRMPPTHSKQSINICWMNEQYMWK